MFALYDRIKEAHARIRPLVAVTPLERSVVLSAALGCEVMLKADHLQTTGSFKLRGAVNKIAVLGADARRAGVITASTGNHGQAAACAGHHAGVAVTVYVPAATTQAKCDAIRSWGAELVVVDGPPIEAERQARQRAETQGIPYISPYNDLDIMAGQGTLGVEMLEQQPDLDAVFISVGGGGLIGGTGTAIKQIRPATQVVGVWPENSPCMLRALEAGHLYDVEEQPTLSDSTAGAVETGSVTFPICQAVIDRRLSVTEAEIGAAMRRIAAADRWMVEGAAGVAMAGLIQQAADYRGAKVAVLMCGRNVVLETFLRAIG
jgi:threonine dehydratase